MALHYFICQKPISIHSRPVDRSRAICGFPLWKWQLKKFLAHAKVLMLIFWYNRKAKGDESEKLIKTLLHTQLEFV